MALTLNITPTEFDSLRQLIEQECGIAVGDDKVYLLETRLSKLAIENGCENFSAFYQKAKSDPLLKAKVIDSMTTNETLWFRDNSPYNTFKKQLYPQFAEQLRKGEKKEIRIWSAACSSGQEPYSLSMLAHEYSKGNLDGQRLVQGGLSITATDISPTVLFMAKTGRYDGISMSRGMPEDLKQKYFTEQGRVFAINDDVKKLVQFQQLNLMRPFDHLGKFDVVMLRNVAIYFSAEVKMDLFRRISRVLNPGGYLFLGSSESLLGYSQDYNTCQFEGCNYYQVKS